MYMYTQYTKYKYNILDKLLEGTRSHFIIFFLWYTTTTFTKNKNLYINT